MEELKEKLDKQKSYLILKDSEAGKNFIKNLEKEITDKIDQIINTYKNITHLELLTLVVQLEALKDLLETIEKAEQRVDDLTKEYEESYKENNQENS